MHPVRYLPKTNNICWEWLVGRVLDHSRLYPFSTTSGPGTVSIPVFGTYYHSHPKYKPHLYINIQPKRSLFLENQWYLVGYYQVLGRFLRWRASVNTQSNPKTNDKWQQCTIKTRSLPQAWVKKRPAPLHPFSRPWQGGMDWNQANKLLCLLAGWVELWVGKVSRLNN